MSDWLDRPMPTSDSGAFKALRVLAWVCLIGGGAIAASTRSGDPIVSPTGVVGWTAAVVAVIGGIGVITLPIYRHQPHGRVHLEAPKGALMTPEQRPRRSEEPYTSSMKKPYRRKVGVIARPKYLGDRNLLRRPLILDGGADARLSARGSRRFTFGLVVLVVLGVAAIVLQRV